VNLRQAAGWLMSPPHLRGWFRQQTPEVQRCLRKSFWIGFGSLFDLEGTATRRARERNHRDLLAALGRETLRERDDPRGERCGDITARPET
jgi:hypothetical protein